ncbi:DUF4381 domain-containing protein [Niveibacterium sp. SC-1]|uniref:DUF4381 domain-containing protein n=1 Tax=Niveibacterium sp. SC-1 TaxID=3135646 RepID=UPI00311FA188
MPEPLAAQSAAALAQLADAPLPAVVPYTPQTWGWVVLGALLLCGVFALARAWLRRYRTRAYRRAALAELDAIEAQEGGVAQRMEAAFALLKRVALAARPREQVAALGGRDWLAYLAGEDRRSGFSESQAETLQRLLYADARLSDSRAEPAQWLPRIRHWIRHHAQPPYSVSGTSLQHPSTDRMQGERS